MPIEDLIGVFLFKFLDANRNGSQLLTAEYFHQKSPFSHLARKGLSRSSFCEARDKLSWEALSYLLEKLPEPTGDWKGHRIRAIDGTKINLPRSKEILTTFPIQANPYGETYYPYANLLAASNVLTGQITHAIVGNKHFSEARNLEGLLCQFRKGDIALVDRGFSQRRVWFTFHEQEQFFLGRLKTKTGGRLKGYDWSKKDQIREVRSPDGTASMDIRVVRGPRLNNGEYVYLVTNLLDTKKYKRRELLNLYKKRQAIENNFKEIKSSMGLTPITRLKKVNNILQEVFAALLAQSMVALIKGYTSLKNKVVSFKGSQHLLKMYLNWADQMTFCYESALYFYHIVQPGRSYPRYSRQPENKWILEKRKRRYFQRKRALMT